MPVGMTTTSVAQRRPWRYSRDYARVEDSHSFGIQPDHLRVDNRGAVYASRVPDDQRIAFRPVGSVHGVEAHPAIPDMDLQPVAVMLQLVRPARSPVGGCLATIGWHG